VLPISQFSIFVLASLAYHDYEGVALRDDEKPRLVADLGDKTFLMLRNPRLLTSATIAAAFGRCTLRDDVRGAARAQAGGSIAAGELIEIDADVLRTAPSRRGWRRCNGPGDLIWPAAAPARSHRRQLSPLMASEPAPPVRSKARSRGSGGTGARSASSSCRAAARSAPTRRACSRRSRR
jgi:hypothetical protein